MTHIENWALRGEFLEFVMASDENTILTGVVGKGKEIAASGITEVSREAATTATGTKYTLGQVDAQYADWIKQYAA